MIPEKLHGEGSEIFETKVRNRAGKIWLDNKGTHGHDFDDWMRAKGQIQEESLNEAIQLEAEGRKLIPVLKGLTTITVGDLIEMRKSKEVKTETVIIPTPEAFRKRVSDRAYFARLGKEPSHDLDVAAYLKAEKIERDLLTNTEKLARKAETAKPKSDLQKQWERAKKYGIVVRTGDPFNRAAADAWDTADRLGVVVETGNLLKRMEKEGQIKVPDLTETDKKRREEAQEKENKDKAKIGEKNSADKTLQAELKTPEVKIGPAFWNGQPVKITKHAGQLDGKDYVFIEGSNVAIPLDEIEYPKEAAGKTSTETKTEKTPAKTERTEADKLAKERETAENKLATEKAAEEQEKQRKLEEERVKGEEAETKRKQELEQARAEGKQEGIIEGKEQGEKEVKEKLWHEIKEKRNIFKKIRILFRPKTEVERYLRKGYVKNVALVVGGAVAAVGIAGALQYFGILPIWLKNLAIYAKEIVIH